MIHSLPKWLQHRQDSLKLEARNCSQACGYAEAQALDPTHTAFKDYMQELDWDWAERQIAHTTSIVRIP